MDAQALKFVEIVNRLKRGTLEGKVLWAPAGGYGQQYTARLDNGHGALVAATPNGMAVLFTMTDSQGAETLHLDSSRVGADLLRLAVLQLFVTVRDTLTHHVTSEALDAVKDL
jgi:hypothetical protein